MGAQDKQLDAIYPMHTREGVSNYLSQYEYIKERIYSKADYGALVMMIDFEKALLISGLSTMELITIQHVYNEDLKQVTVAEMYDVTRQTVNTWVNRATDKIANYYAEELKVGESDG